MESALAYLAVCATLAEASRCKFRSGFNGLSVPGGFLPPRKVRESHRTGAIPHYGQADAVYAARQQTLDRAFAEHPERFVKQPPTPPQKPTAAWINPPQTQANPTSLN